MNRISIKAQLFVLSCVIAINSSAQQFNQFGLKVNPMSVEGSPIQSVVILLNQDGQDVLSDSLETTAFYQAFGVRPGSLFRRQIMDYAIDVINKQDDIKSSYYEVFNYEFGGPLTIVIHVQFLKKGENKIPEAKKGILTNRKMRGFPTLVESENTKLTLILNGALGLYNEENAFFSQGAAFTQGNPVATDPAGVGPRFWGEAYVEPGIAGMTRLGKSRLYPYGAVSYLISGRNASDIYSEGRTGFGAFERLYAGILIPQLGKKKDIHIDLSAGRQFFQLNDGFLFSRFSGSANAGDRGSVYLNSRTTFQMTALAKIHYNKLNVEGFYLEPQELFNNAQSDTRYLGGSINFNDNKNINAGISYANIVNSKSTYATPNGRIPLEGLYAINPKIWLTNIAGTGLFVKTEYVYQGNTNADMQSNAWYVGGGVLKKQWKGSPGLYYRYGFMKGDDDQTDQYERYDGLLTGGLGNWVQGINFRKIVGDGNIVSHRLELKGYLSQRTEFSLDYFFLQANSLDNLGSLAPISALQAKQFGHEVTFTGRYFIGSHYMFLGLVSWAKPSEGIVEAFEGQVYNWTSVQASLFMFF
jgi:hypothetical protein